MLEIFRCHDEDLRALWRRKFDPERNALYRGWFPAQSGALSYKRGIDMGPDVAWGAEVTASDDPLREPTPMPEAQSLAEWHEAVAAYYRGMEQTGQVLMQSLARGMGLHEHVFDDAFRSGISTLRLIEYPPRPQEVLESVDANELWVEHEGRHYQVIGKAHVDSGLLTLLAQDGVPGLQARLPSGEWCDVPPAEGTLAVNFGKLLQDWSGGRIQATEHRVLGSGELRHSVPFFYEPHVDAVISPLTDSADFEPFLYGDHLWAAMTRFVEFEGMEHLRPPRGARAADPD
jgi:isopenicillin N synthase-like dioxygenase